MHIILAVLFIVCAYRWGDWKNWHQYYPTMLFFGFGDLAYNCLFHNKMLWQYQSPIFPIIPHVLWSMLWIFTIFASTLLIYLPKFPPKASQRIFYVLLWVTLYTLVEGILSSSNHFKYMHGWSLLHSFIFNTYIFPVLYIHFKKPLYAWIMVFLAAIFTLILFEVPLLNKVPG